MRLFLLLTLSFCASLALRAQNITSPYSILGIGDIDTKYYGKFFGMSSATQAVRSASYINLDNPASLTALDPNMLNIDINGRWRSSSFGYPGGDSFTSSYNDAAIRRLSLTFRPGKSWGFSFGIKPFSTVNYLIDEKLVLQNGGISNINKTVTGSGGVYQAYLANGFRLSKNFSAGLTVSYLGGSLSRSTAYYYEDLGINIQRKEDEVLKGGQLQGGFQYSGKISDRLSQVFGITATVSTKLKGTFETEYVDSDSTISSSKISGKTFTLPLQVALGYALVIDDMITIATDYRKYNWEAQKLDYPNAYTQPAQRFSLGFQYAPQRMVHGQMKEKISIQAGIAYEETYLSIKNKPVNDISATVGVGCNMTRLLNVYLGIEVGRKGDKTYGQITENYTQISMGVTLKEFWSNTKKMRLYN